MTQRMMILPIALLFLTLVIMAVNSMSFLFPEEKTFLYLTVSIFVGALAIYVLSDI